MKFPLKFASLGVVAAVVFAGFCLSFCLSVQSAFAQSNPNLALNRPTDASSNQSIGSLAVDGQTDTRWGSGYSDPNWFSVDLGASYPINRVFINWEVAYGEAYEIQVSDDAQTWTTIYSTEAGDGGIDDLSVSGTGRYVRMYGIKRGTKWGYSMWEFEVYGGDSTPTPTPTPEPTPTPTPSPTPTPAPSTNFSLLPLGDSITALSGENSYRRYLKQHLDAAGYSYTFVGSMNDSIGRHEGHSGWKADEVRDALPGWLGGYTPDAVLLHVGTNDALGGQSGSGTLIEIEDIIKRLRADNPKVKIILAKIIPAPIRTLSDSSVKKQNAGTDALAAKLQSSQSPIVVVDHFTPFDPSKDLQDSCKCHPTKVGAQKMAVVWFDGIKKLYSVGTSTTPAPDPDPTPIPTAPTVSLTASPQTISVGSSTTLTWTSSNASSCAAANFAAGTGLNGSITVSPTANTTYTIACTGAGGTVVANAAVSVIAQPDVPAPTSNLALNRPTNASSNKSTGARAVDGKTSTYWGSSNSDKNWLYVDLGSSYALNKVYINWEPAYGKAYKIQVSKDAKNWSTIYSTTKGNGGIDDLSVKGSGRYVRMYGVKRGTKQGYSIREFEAYGQ